MPGPAIALAGASLGSGLMQANAAKKGADANSKAAKDATALQKYIYDQTTANFAPFLSSGKDAMSAYLYEMGLGPKPTIGGKPAEIEKIYGGRNTQEVIGGVRQGNLNNRMATDKITGYKVGDKQFSTLAEAEKFANENPVGGTEYQGYSVSPMAKYLMEKGTDSIQGSAAAQGGLFSGATLQALEDNRRELITADTQDYFSKLFGLTNMGMSAAGNQANAGSAYAGNAGNLAMAAGQAKAQGYAGQANAFSNTLGDMAGIYGYFNNPMAAYSSPTMMGGFGGGK